MIADKLTNIRNACDAITYVVCCLAALLCLYFNCVAQAEAPQPVQVLPVARDCRGSCVPSLHPLANDRALLAWRGEAQRTWAQLVDLASGRLLGGAVELGDIATAPLPASQPVVVSLPDGDVAVFGVLSDGRVTLMRGSLDARRRLAPKVISSAQSLEVLELVASGVPDTLGLLVLRGEHSDNSRALRTSVMAEVAWLDAVGGLLRAPIRWKSGFATAPRIASCHGRLYVVWQGNQGLVGTVLSAKADRAIEQSIRYGRYPAANLGPLVCAEPGVRLFSAARKLPFSIDLAPELLSVELRETKAPGHVAASAWKARALPGPPTASNGRTDVYAVPGGVQLVVQRATEERLISVPSRRDAEVSTLWLLPRSRACIPVAEGKRAACVEVEREPGRDEGCTAPTTAIRLAFYGQAALKSEPSLSSYEFWKLGPVPEARAPAQWQLAWERSRVLCREKEFRPLRDALQAWCADSATKPSQEQGFTAFCDPQESASLLSLATNCSSRPSKCSVTTAERMPSVDRAEFERGERVEFSYMNCSIWFSRRGTAWVVDDRECEGD